MKAIAALNSFTVIVGSALMVAGCGPKIDHDTPRRIAAACVRAPVPTDDEIRKMPTALLYRWYQASREATDLLGRGQVFNLPADPCLVALSQKYDDLERELKFR